VGQLLYEKILLYVHECIFATGLEHSPGVPGGGGGGWGTRAGYLVCASRRRSGGCSWECIVCVSCA
jgi:hypothetical protein